MPPSCIPRQNFRWVAALAVCLGIFSVAAQPPHAHAQKPQPLMAGQPAPDIDKGGDWLGVKERLTLKDLRGKFVLLDFWTLC